MRIAWWIPKTTDTHSEYVIRIFPLQKWLHERLSMLRYTYILLWENRKEKTILNDISPLTVRISLFLVRHPIHQSSSHITNRTLYCRTSVCVCMCVYIYIYIYIYIYRVSKEECARLRECVPYDYTDITQKTYIQSWTFTEIMAREVWNFDSCYSLIDYQIHIETGRNMWFL